MSIVSVLIGNFITLAIVLGFVKFNKNVSLDNFAEKIAKKLKKNAD